MTRLLSVSTLLLARSLRNNKLGAEGVSALAAILNTTKITHLECATAPEAFASLSAPMNTPQHPPAFTRAHSLGWNNLGPKGAAALVEALKGNLTLQVLE